MTFATTLRDVEMATLQAMRRILVSRRNDSGHEHNQRDQLAAIDAEIERRHFPQVPSMLASLLGKTTPTDEQRMQLDRNIRRIDDIIERLRDGRLTLPRPGAQRDVEFARVVSKAK